MSGPRQAGALVLDGSSIETRCTLSEERKPVLIDTNVLVDAIDPREQSRASISSVVLNYVARAGALVVSTQVIAEYYDVTTRPKRGNAPILTRAAAALSIADLLAITTCIDVTQSIVREAVRIARTHQIRIYDAQLNATAQAYHVPIIVTGDLPGGRTTLEEVRYADLHSDSFQLTDIGL
jgi:predicted nucleic acid-binding protein